MASEEYFVSLVEKNRSLWDKGHKEYKNLKQKEKLWANIGQLCGITGDDAAVLFNSIRLKYVRRKSEMKCLNKSGSAAKTLKPWALHEQLKFLEDTIVPRKTVSSILQTQTSSTQSPSCRQEAAEGHFLDATAEHTKDDAENYFSMSMSVSEESLPLLSPSTPIYINTNSGSSTPKSQPSTSRLLKPSLKRKKHEDTIDKIAAAISAPVEIRECTSVDKWCVSEEIQNFCKFLGNRLNELPKKKLREAESLILNVVRDMEEDE